MIWSKDLSHNGSKGLATRLIARLSDTKNGLQIEPDEGPLTTHSGPTPGRKHLRADHFA